MLKPQYQRRLKHRVHKNSQRQTLFQNVYVALRKLSEKLGLCVIKRLWGISKLVEALRILGVAPPRVGERGVELRVGANT